MPATLSLENRILTLTDEGQTSAVDLSDIKGDMGVRGEQGERGQSAADLGNYYTKAEVENLITTTDTHYNAFWDAYQENGNRSDYNYAFYGVGWNPETYKPKYTVRPTAANYTYMYSTIEEIDTVDLSECTGCNATFSNAKQLKTINHCILGDKISALQNMFRNCEGLENVGFEGTLAKTGLTLQYSPNLSKESIILLFNVLADVNGSGTHTLTIGETNMAKLTATELQIATNKGWEIN